MAYGAAFCGGSFDDDHGVHALVFHFHPVALVAHQRLVIGGGIEIFGRAAIALHGGEHGVARFGGSATQLQQTQKQQLHLGVAFGFYFQAQIRIVRVGAPDAKLLDLEAAVVLDHRVEDLLHHMRVDQMAFGFNNFLFHLSCPWG